MTSSPLDVFEAAAKEIIYRRFIMGAPATATAVSALRAEAKKLVKAIVGDNETEHKDYCDLTYPYENMECSCEVLFRNELRADLRVGIK